MTTDSGASRERSELLVVLDDARAAQALERIRADHRVAQQVSRRVVVVEGSGQREETQLRAIPGVRAVSANDPAPDALEGLDEVETLFIRAWAHRMKTFSSKQRRGDGVAWDAPGREPPDLPRGTHERKG